MSREDNLRAEILLQLYGSRPLSRTAEFMARESGKNGMDFTAREIASELIFLRDEKLVADEVDPASAAKRWRITSAGVRWYAERHG